MTYKQNAKVSYGEVQTLHDWIKHSYQNHADSTFKFCNVYSSAFVMKDQDVGWTSGFCIKTICLPTQFILAKKQMS
jgi:hypothetical protein